MEGKDSISGLQPQELLKRAQTYDYRSALPPDEYEALMKTGAQLTKPPRFDSQCFILGSYDTEANEKQKLLYLKEEIKKWTGEHCRPYLMEDFDDRLHSITQFKLIADHSDYIIGVCEHDEGGFQLEFGMILAIAQYFDQTCLLKRRYPDQKRERRRYNGMLNPDVFGMFDYHNKLWEWETPREYKVEVTNLLSEVLNS